MSKNLRRKLLFWTFITCLLAIGTLGFGKISRGEENGTVETKYFHVNLEGQWVEMPDEALSAYSEYIRSQYGQKAKCLAGYVSTSGDNWFELPYILVVSHENGKLPHELLDSFNKIISELTNGVQEHIAQLGDVKVSLQAGKTYYDERRRIVWMNAVVDNPELGKIHCIVARMLTEIGTLDFTLAVPHSARETRLLEFNDLLNRVTLDPALVYRPDLKETLKIVGRGMTDAIDRSRSRGLFYGFIMLCIALFAGAYRFLISKFKDNRKKAIKTKLETEGYGVSNGVGKCFNCEKKVTFEEKESSLFCPECGWEREASIQKRLGNKKIGKKLASF
jgi:predicted RNA-binding Zn-ribbon protein involved in translation (DUF1610 family)